MKTIRFLLPALLLLPAAFAVADDTAAVKKHLTEVYSRIASLTKSKDIKGLEQMMTAGSTRDFVYEIAPGKMMDLKKTIAMMKTQLSMPGAIKTSQNDVQKVTRMRNAAIAHVVGSISGTMVIQGKVHTFSATEVSDDTWVNMDGIWKLKYIKTRQTTQLFDGRHLAK